MKPKKINSVPVRLGAFLLLLGLVLSACAPVTEAPTAVPTVVSTPTIVDLMPQLADKLWVLTAYGDATNPTVVEEGTKVTAVFATDGNLSGSGGCNNYNSTYQLAGDQITISPISSTKMACENGMDQETIVLSALQNAERIVFNSQERLEIYYNSGTTTETKLIFVPGETPLVGTIWVMESYGDVNNPTPAEKGISITAGFSPEGTISGSSGCNSYSAAYAVQGSSMQIQPAVSTLMACPQGMEQEADYLAALDAVESYQIIGVRLQLLYAGGTGVVNYTSTNLPLENTLWTLVMLNGVPSTDDPAPVTALFDPGDEPQKGVLGGVAQCNNYQTNYTVDGTSLTVEQPTATRMYCSDERIQAETTYLQLLETAQSYNVLGQTLTITSEGGTLIFTANRAPLEGTFWRLTAMGPVSAPQAPISGADFTALFVRQPGAVSGVIVGGTGCNDYNATYTGNLNEIKVNLPVKTNNAGCPAGLSSQEGNYFLALNSATSYRILGDTLQIPYGDEQMLSFTAFIPEVPAPLSALNGTHWWLVSMSNRALLSGSEVTADFAINSDGLTGTISGSAGCNTYSAEILDFFQLAPPSSTNLTCSEPAGVMDQESTYLTMLSTANSISLAYNQLLIGTASGLLVYSNSPVPMAPAPTPLPSTPTPPVPTPTLAPSVPTPTATIPLTAIIIPPTEGLVANTPLLFDGSTSQPTDGSIVQYTWDFGDDSVVPEQAAKVMHTYIAPGTYTVTLTVTNAAGQTNMATVDVTIQ